MSRTPMKLILTQEVTGLGAPGDVVDVAAGYGRNYLIPRGFAMNWTRGAEKQIDLIKRARAAREIRGVEDAKVVAARLEGLHVRMRRRAGGSGRLFGSVGPVDIAAAVRLMRQENRDKRAGWSLRYSRILREPESFRDLVLQSRKAKRDRTPVVTGSRTAGNVSIATEVDPAANQEPTPIARELRKWREAQANRIGGTP